MRGTMDLLVPAYEKLLQDPEAEVRIIQHFYYLLHRFSTF
jgi:hypothetical protein